MTIQEYCDVCRQPVSPEKRQSYQLGAASLVHCDKPGCLAEGKEWRIQQLKLAAQALGLCKTDLEAAA